MKPYRKLYNKSRNETFCCSWLDIVRMVPQLFVIRYRTNGSSVVRD